MFSTSSQSFFGPSSREASAKALHMLAQFPLPDSSHFKSKFGALDASGWSLVVFWASGVDLKTPHSHFAFCSSSANLQQKKQFLIKVKRGNVICELYDQLISSSFTLVGATGTYLTVNNTTSLK